MTNDQIKLSYQPLILVGGGAVPTVPAHPSALPNDDGWVDETDILIGQVAFNLTDNLFYTRGEDGIIPLKDTMAHTHDQGVPSDEWVITHNLKFRPSVTTVNTAGEVCIGSVTYIDENSLKIEFSGGFSGKAYLN